MALRYAILGLLSAEPMSGYDLAKWMDRGLGNIWSAHASQIYPELARMVEAGVIVEVPGDTGPRRRRVYGISDDGAADLREWLTTATLDPGGRNEALLRSVLLGQLDPPLRRAGVHGRGRAAPRARDAPRGAPGRGRDEGVSPRSAPARLRLRGPDRACPGGVGSGGGGRARGRLAGAARS